MQSLQLQSRAPAKGLLVVAGSCAHDEGADVIEHAVANLAGLDLVPDD